MPLTSEVQRCHGIHRLRIHPCPMGAQVLDYVGVVGPCCQVQPADTKKRKKGKKEGTRSHVICTRQQSQSQVQSLHNSHEVARWMWQTQTTKQPSARCTNNQAVRCSLDAESTREPEAVCAHKQPGSQGPVQSERKKRTISTPSGNHRHTIKEPSAQHPGTIREP